MSKKIYLVAFMTCLFVSFYNVIKYYNDNSLSMFKDIDSIESNVESAISQDNTLKEIYGLVNLAISPKEIENTVKDEDGFLLPITNTEFDVVTAADNIAKLRDECEKNGVDFAYISYPSKNMSDDYMSDYYINGDNEELRTTFLNEIEKNGVDILDIRRLMEEQGYSNKDIFYKTDHHWNTRSGLYAAREISKYINDEYGYKTYTENLDEDKLVFKEYTNAWFGETGRKLSKTWVGALDDFTLIKPNYDTSFEYIITGVSNKSGDFSLLLDESMLGTEYDLYTTDLHYSYMPDVDLNTVVQNKNINDGAKILIVRDSFSIVVVPFLSLTCSEVNMWDMRNNTESLYEYIKNNDFDMVIVAYTDYWSDEMYSFY